MPRKPLRVGRTTSRARPQPIPAPVTVCGPGCDGPSTASPIPACSPRARPIATPRPSTPVAFLAERGTLYVVGSTGAQLSVAPLITALVEDLAERALGLASRSPHGRSTRRSRCFSTKRRTSRRSPRCRISSRQVAARASAPSSSSSRSRRHAPAGARTGPTRSGTRRRSASCSAGSAMRTTSRVSAGSPVRSTRRSDSTSRGSGGTTWSTSLRSRPVLPLERIRSLPAGRALILHRRTPPVEAVLAPWWERPSADRVRAALADATRRCAVAS